MILEKIKMPGLSQLSYPIGSQRKGGDKLAIDLGSTGDWRSASRALAGQKV